VPLWAPEIENGLTHHWI